MQVSDILSAILVGAVIGLLGRLVLPGRQRIGIFATFCVGVVAALLGLFLSRWLKIDGHHEVRLWKLHWDWIVLALQVGLAVVGVGLANVLTYTRLAGGDERPRRRTTRRSRSRARD